MSAVLDLAPAPMVAAGGYAWPDDVAAGQARQARIDLWTAKEPMHTAEDFVAAVGFDWHLPAVVREALKAAVAELVDNAARHAAWPRLMHVVLVDVVLHAHRVVLEVRDPDPYLPPIPDPAAVLDAVLAALADPEVGPEALERAPRGLAYLSGLCESLAALREPVGKVMRAAVALPDPRAGSVTGLPGDVRRFEAPR
jgi:anti-sigma regulatory factor (Ser/Thr protein kinase)